MHYSIDRLSKKFANRRRLASFGAMLAFLLVVVQSGELIHTHDSDLQQVDCEICLKVGSNEDVIASTAATFDSSSATQTYFELVVSSPYLAILSANPRAPPHA